MASASVSTSPTLRFCPTLRRGSVTDSGSVKLKELSLASVRPLRQVSRQTNISSVHSVGPWDDHAALRYKQSFVEATSCLCLNHVRNHRGGNTISRSRIWDPHGANDLCDG